MLQPKISISTTIPSAYKFNSLHIPVRRTRRIVSAAYDIIFCLSSPSKTGLQGSFQLITRNGHSLAPFLSNICYIVKPCQSVKPLYRRHCQAATVFLELSLTLKDSGLRLIHFSTIPISEYKDISSAG